MTVVGSRKMIVHDDAHTEGKVRVYDKGAFRSEATYGDFSISCTAATSYSVGHA